MVFVLFGCLRKSHQLWPEALGAVPSCPFPFHASSHSISPISSLHLSHSLSCVLVPFSARKIRRFTAKFLTQCLFSDKYLYKTQEHVVVVVFTLFLICFSFSQSCFLYLATAMATGRVCGLEASQSPHVLFPGGQCFCSCLLDNLYFILQLANLGHIMVQGEKCFYCSLFLPLFFFSGRASWASKSVLSTTELNPRVYLSSPLSLFSSSLLLPSISLPPFFHCSVGTVL